MHPTEGVVQPRGHQLSELDSVKHRQSCFCTRTMAGTPSKERRLDDIELVLVGFTVYTKVFDSKQ
jgi:hypothetical protein